MRTFNSICFIVPAGLLCFYSCLVLADTHYVRPSPCTNTSLQSPYTSWDTAATNIQWAVNAASVGETVWVSNGTYCLTNQIEITNNITVQSTNGYSNTLVYAGWPTYTTRCFYVVNTGIVDGFTVSNGHFIGSNLYISGGGAFISNATVRNCYFVNNINSNAGELTGGGGVFSKGSSLVFNCTFYSNTCYVVAGGSERIGGGGIFCIGGSSIIGCTIVSNYKYGTGSRYAAGITAHDTSANALTLISNCFIACNSGGQGGLYAEELLVSGRGRQIYVNNCVISNNSPGGVCANGSRYKDCLIINNQGLGFFDAWGAF